MEKDFRLFLERKELSETTIKRYILLFKKIDYLVKEIGELDQNVVNGFLDIYNHGLARSFLKNYMDFLDVTFKIPKITGKKPSKEIKPLSSRELFGIREKLYDHNERWGLVFDLTFSCALRRQEVINIKVGDIRVENDKMFILIKKGKGKKERFVFVERPVAELVLHYVFARNLQTDQYLFESPVKEGFPIDVTVWNKAFSKASQKKFHPHLLRHQRSLDWFNKGLDIVRIQQRLGHSTISTTRKYINPDAKQELRKWSEE